MRGKGIPPHLALLTMSMAHPAETFLFAQPSLAASFDGGVKNLRFGEARAPVRHTWLAVHERARRIAGGLAAAGVGHGDPVGVLAGAPVEIAPTAQGLCCRCGRRA
jgi:acyl-CoA synthetase (AMP-forming)/AMP-acid ligase II